MNIDQLTETRRIILLAIKREGSATIAELSSLLEMTREAVRQQLLQLVHEGWISGHLERDSSNGGGRPSMRYRLSTAGEHLFPKSYDVLTLELLDTVSGQLGSEAVIEILSRMTDKRVLEWESRLSGLNLGERLEALKEIYLDDDPYMDVEYSGNDLALIERNCPFLNVAQERPILCNVTVNMLTRLLGYRVIREERFQNGNGRCVFRVKLDQSIDKNSFRFAFEY